MGAVCEGGAVQDNAAERAREADDVPVCEATGESGQHEECDAMCAGPDAQAEGGCAEHRLHGERARGQVCVNICDVVAGAAGAGVRLDGYSRRTAAVAATSLLHLKPVAFLASLFLELSPAMCSVGLLEKSCGGVRVG